VRDHVVFKAMFRIRSLFAVLFVGATIALTLLDSASADRRLAVWLMFLMLLSLPFELQALFDSRKLSRWDVPGKLAGRLGALLIILVCWLVDGTLTLTEVALCSSINLLVNSIISWRIAQKIGLIRQFSGGPAAQHPGFGALVRAETKRLLKLGAPIMWANLMVSVYLFSQTILVKWFSTDLETGFYALASRIILPLALVKGILYRLILPLLSEAGNDPTAFNTRLEKLIFMPVTALAFIACEVFLIPIFGAEYAHSVLPAQISLSHLFLTGMGSIFGTALFALGYQKTYTWSLTVGCVICLSLGAFLIPRYGANGAAWATVAAECTAVLVTIPPLLKHARPKILQKITRIGLAALTCIPVYYALVRGFDFAPLVGFAAGIIVVAGGLWASGEISPQKLTMVVDMLKKKAD
jgi:O-antigen/teichoic acid export membrane protein